VKIEYASTTLFDQELPAQHQTLRIEAEVASEVLEWFKGGSAVPIPRGGRRRVLPLTIATEYTSQRLAEEAWLDHYDDLPDTGALTFTCGYTGDTSTRTVSAVLERCIPRLVAPRVLEVEYLFTFTAAPA
jgi:hypothetical protein